MADLFAPIDPVTKALPAATEARYSRELVDTAAAGATVTAVAGQRTIASAAGAVITAPALSGTATVPGQRFAVRNSSTGSQTLTYPNSTGVSTTITLLPGSVHTFRQTGTTGWMGESGLTTLASLDGRFASLASPAFSGTPTINGVPIGSGAAVVEPIQLEGAPAYLYGHSYLASDVYNSGSGAAGRWASRVVSRARMGAMTTRAVNGRKSQDMARDIASSANAWIPGTRGLVMLTCTINDVDAYGGLATYIRQYGYGWDASLALLRAKAKYAANTAGIVYNNASTWTADTTNAPIGGTRYVTTTVGDYAQLAVTGDAVDVYLAARSGSAGGVVTFTSSGVTVATTNLTSPVGTDFSLAVTRITGLGAGDHTVTATLTSGGSLAIEGFSIPSEAPPPVVVYAEGTVLSYHGNDVPTRNGFLTGSYLPLLTSVCAAYPNVTLVTAGTDWDPATMLRSDDQTAGDAYIHPNDKGASYIATRALAALSTAGFSNGLNKIGANPSYTPPATPAIPSSGKDGAGNLGSSALSNTAAPAITGTATTGNVLTVSNGTWSPTPDSYTYVWKRAGTAISGATAATYTLVVADEGQAITATVTAVKAGYSSASTTSASVTPSAPGSSTLTNSTAPTIAGSTTVGSTLTAGNGTWSAPPDSYTYVWKRDGVAISGATTSTYVLVTADQGHAITVTVTAVKAGYTSGSATSAATSISAAASIADSFTRADSTSTMGSTETGALTWTPLGSGVWGIFSNAAKAISGSDTVVTVNAGSANFTAQVTVASLASGSVGDLSLAFRFTDLANGWLLYGANAATWKLAKKVAGAYTFITPTTAITPAVGQVLKVVTTASSITAYVNGTLISTSTDAFNQTATLVGLRTNTGLAVGTFDDFSVTPG